jgi:geranylgeranyl pyrophosphate synthase
MMNHEAAESARGIFLQELDEYISRALSWEEEALGPKPELLLEAARQACFQRHAKRLRPQLVLLCGTLLEAPRDQLLAVAAASELFHTGSLLHDDIIDNATERRSQPTANARWGGTVAVLAGDLALSLGLVLLRNVPHPVTVGAAHTIAVMTQGAIAESQARGAYDLPLERWRQIAESKTGALFAFCGLGAAHLVGDAEAVRRLQTFGCRVGVAFQIADDLIDLLGDGKGRERFADIRNREVAFPTLLAARSSDDFARLIEKLWSNGSSRECDIEAVARVLLRSGVVESALAQIHEEIEAAIASLGDFCERPAGHHLAAWAKSLEARTEQYVHANRYA